MKKTFSFLLTLSVIALLGLNSCDNDSSDPSIAVIATADPDLSTLLDALQRTGLDATLNDPGTYTVFAPTNAAFDSAFAALGLTNGLDDLDNATLTNILLYHVLGQTVPSPAVPNGYVNTLATGPGSNSLSMLLSNTNGVMIQGSATVTTADIIASNGTIHKIDQVLLPPTVVDAAIANSEFSPLVGAVVHAGLDGVLASTDSTFTVFAPTSQAFIDIAPPSGDVTGLPMSAVSDILLDHVINGVNVQSSQLMNGQTVTTMGGLTLTFDLSGSPVTINDSINIVATDVQCTNGVIHVIDAVLIE
jgi:uncharacterized surface protein with fasciclin (FAS1) repeats